MAAFRDDMPLVAGINENWDEDTTRAQIVRPDWDFSPIRMKTMHHLPHIFFDTLRPERPDCPVLIPSTFSVVRDRIISQDIYSYEPCDLPTGDFMPAEHAQIRLMTASPVTLRVCIPAPDQVTPDQVYFRDLNFYKKTLFHTPFLSRGRAVTLLEYRDAQVIFEVDDWFNTLPAAVQHYLLPLQSKYAKWYNETVRDLPQNYAFCDLCKQKTANMQRHYMQHHTWWRTIWFCPLPGCPISSPNKEGLVRHLQSKQHAKGIDMFRGRTLAKQIVKQNCFWPLNQTFADKLLRASKRLLRYVALYSMAGVAIENRLFRIPSCARDTTFIDACAAFLTPKMGLSQVMPSGCNLRRVAVQPRNQLAVPERPSASAFSEDQSVVDPATMQMDLAIPAFQPYRGETGRAWMASEYGITADTSSLISSASGTEREDTDEEICSFDLGPEPFDPEGQGRLSADDWLDDFQQGLVPGGSQPRNIDYNKYLAKPKKTSILDMMRQDIADNDEVPPTSPERALTPTIGFDYDYATNAPPDIQRVEDAPMHSTPYPDPPTLSARPGPVLLPLDIGSTDADDSTTHG